MNFLMSARSPARPAPELHAPVLDPLLTEERVRELADAEPGMAFMAVGRGEGGGGRTVFYRSYGGRAAPAKDEAPGAAPVATWKRSELVPNTSRLMIGDKEELALQGMQARVRIDGFRARVYIDCYYYNDRDRPFEGNFQLRLPNDASPFFFAFGETAFKAPEGAPDRPLFYTLEEAQQMGANPTDVMHHRAATWSQPKEARVVPQEKAAYAYRETVRRAVDPALMEWSGAGIFSARVFPLAPKKLHRVVMGYDVDLLRAGGDLVYALDLPSGVREIVADLEVEEIPGVAVSLEPKAGPFKAGGRAYYRFEKPEARTLTVRLAAAGPVLLTGTDPKTGPYFAARFRPELPAEAAAGAGSSCALFLVDASLSSNPERFGVWLKLMKAILDGNRDAIRSFDVLFFNIEAFAWREAFVENSPANVDALMRFADTLALEGATDLGAALEKASGHWGPAGDKQAPRDLFLLSDGSPTWGEGDLHALSNRLKGRRVKSLFAYTTGLAGTDTRVLEHLARESGGAVFSVVGEAVIAKAATAHRARPWRIEGVEVKGGSDLLLAGRPKTVFPGQELTLVGRGEVGAGAVAVLKLQRGTEIKSLPVTFSSALPSDLAPRLYGQVATGQLESLAEATEETSKAYATHFRVTGRTCSLLMLETEEDYKRFNIKPEEDAFVVKATPASDAVVKALASIGEALGDPKAGFLAWLKKMEGMPGVEFKVPAALRLALDGMPAAAFAVVPPPLDCTLRTRQGVPGAIQEQLASRQLDYDALTGEAVRRLKDLGPADALKALSSLVENSPGDGVLARDVGFSAMEWGLGGQAVHLFRRVAASRPWEPPTYHAMALALAEMKQADLALAYYEVGLAGKWDGRFGEFRKILGQDYLRFLRRIGSGELKTSVPEYAKARLETVGAEFDAGKSDLRVVIAWNTDGTDVDLHVVEPTGEECYYKNTKTKIGGEITADVTQGYGPEMYVIRKARPGSYAVRVKYFSSDRNRASARTKVYATVIEKEGTPQEKVTRKVVALADGKEMHDIATVTVGR